MAILIYLFIFASVLSLTMYFLLMRRSFNLPPAKGYEPEKKADAKGGMANLVSALTRPLSPLNRAILSRFNAQDLADRLSSAEVKLLPAEYLGFKEILIAAICAVVFLGAERMEPVWLVFIFLGGYILPDIYLRLRIKKRNAMILKALPEVIDLLTLCVGGGLDFMQGMDWVIKRSPPGPLIKELSIVTQEVKIGKSRQQALKAMSRRLKIPEVFSLINTLVSADRMGSPVYEVLDALGEETRRQRFQRGERLALQAPIKMLFPLVFCILPVVAIIVGGPILIQFMQGGLTKGFGTF
ncbi:type II secretion system F family protein [Candidatus Omnitrophota bacterium]